MKFIKEYMNILLLPNVQRHPKGVTGILTILVNIISATGKPALKQECQIKRLQVRDIINTFSS